jgi:hypothetical protein
VGLNDAIHHDPYASGQIAALLFSHEGRKPPDGASLAGFAGLV